MANPKSLSIRLLEPSHSLLHGGAHLAKRSDSSALRTFTSDELMCAWMCVPPWRLTHGIFSWFERRSLRLSVSPHQLPMVKSLVRSVRLRGLESLAVAALAAPTSKDARAVLESGVRAAGIDLDTFE